MRSIPFSVILSIFIQFSAFPLKSWGRPMVGPCFERGKLIWGKRRFVSHYVSSPTRRNFYPFETKGGPLEIRGGSSPRVTDVQQEELSLSNVTISSATSNVSSIQNLTFHVSKHGDGSESDPDGLPRRFLETHKGDRMKALHAFNQTSHWRMQNNVDTILSRPHTKFDVCRQIFPAYIPGRDINGNIILIQRLGMVSIDLAEKYNITFEEVLMHYVYIVEYVWNILNPDPQGLMTSVLDLDGLSFNLFSNKVTREFGFEFVKMMSNHYPARSYKTLIINAPTWFNAMYRAVKGFLRESTRKKIEVLRKGPEQDQKLIEVLGVDSVPLELLSQTETSNQIRTEIEAETKSLVPKAGPNSSIELELRQFCSIIMEKHNLSMSVYA
mmetsp:Transcript_73/g.100  ORF Transcript_73/g.100 Transcript_73/m.100 type:complete len:383 (+) Transcript_73:30-1178(+)